MHRICLVALVLALGAAPLHAAPLTIGNFLISDETQPGRIREFNSAGALVQTFNLGLSPGDPSPRDIVMDVQGNIQVYNGTFSPFLTTLNPASAMIKNNTNFPGWSTIANITYGGIAAFGDFVFVSDMATAGAGSPNGIVRFNVKDFSGLRFASGPVNGSGDVIDLTIGRDGLLYAQFPGTSPGGNQVDVYDPTTLAFIRRIGLGTDLRTIAVDANGDIFAANINDPNIYHFDSTGKLIRAVDTGVRGFADIDIDADGRLIAASGPIVVLTDRTLSSFTALNVGTTSPVGTFVSFVQTPLGVPAVIPEPGTFVLLGIGIVGVCGYGWRRLRLA